MRSTRMPRQAQVPWYPSQLISVANGYDDFRCERTRRKQYAPPWRGIKIWGISYEARSCERSAPGILGFEPAKRPYDRADYCFDKPETQNSHYHSIKVAKYSFRSRLCLGWSTRQLKSRRRFFLPPNWMCYYVNNLVGTEFS